MGQSNALTTLLALPVYYDILTLSKQQILLRLGGICGVYFMQELPENATVVRELDENQVLDRKLGVCAIAAESQTEL